MKDKLKALGVWLIARAQEKTTWAGLVLVITAIVGHQLPNEWVDAITWVGPFVGGALAAYEEKQTS